MDRVYILDASAIVDAWKYWYGPESHPGVWTHIETACHEGKILIPYEVIDELMPTGPDDRMGAWLSKRRKRIGTPSDQLVQRIVGQVQTRHPRFGGAGLGDKNYADTFLVAHALARSGGHATPIIVTHEEMAKKDARPRIPNVCLKEGIKVTKIHQVIKSHGLSFTLDP